MYTHHTWECPVVIASATYTQHAQVWGCGGLQAAEYQSKLKQWEEKAILKSRNVSYAGGGFNHMTLLCAGWADHMVV